MKRQRASTAISQDLTVVGMALLAALPTQTARAQSGGDLVIKRSVIAAGGGTVTGDDLRITGTVGQHNAGRISGGDYVVSGGFWSPSLEDSPSPPVTLVADPSGLNKTRFISFYAVIPGSAPLGIRVHLASLHEVIPPYSGGATTSFDAFEGESLWVGPPTLYAESSSGGAQFHASHLQCTPHYRNWSTVGLLHVTGSAVAPSSTYHAEMLAGTCQGVEDSPPCSPGGANVSGQLQIRTTRWGDMRSPYNPPDPSVQPDISDVAALVDKFRNAPGSPIKARAILVSGTSNPWGDMSNGVLQVDLGFSQISACVDAFRGLPYPYKMGKCAGAPTPPATGACNADSECTGNNGTSPCNLYCP